MGRELVPVVLFRGPLREQRVWWGSDDSGHRDSMDQEEGSYLVFYSFPRLAQVGPSPGPELMNSPAEDRQATGRAV